MGDGGAFSGFVVLYGMLLLLILAIVWIVLPFAVFGIKPLLRKVLEEQRRTNALLAEAAAARTTPPTRPPT